MSDVSLDLMDFVLKNQEALLELQRTQSKNQNEQRMSLLLGMYGAAFTVYKKQYPQSSDTDAHEFARFMAELAARG